MKKKLNRDQIKNASTYILVTVAFIILQLLSAQGKLNSTTKGFLVPACAYIVLAVSLNLLVGICGELSLGHAGFMGIGAFIGIIVTSLLAEAVPMGSNLRGSAAYRTHLAAVLGERCFARLTAPQKEEV